MRPRSGRLRKILFGSIIGAIGLVALEVALRMTGAVELPSVPPSPVAFQQEDSEPNHADEHGFTPCGGDASRTCLQEAPGLRVLVFGGSAAAGTPFSPYGSFSGWLQRYLHRLSGDVPVEVINSARIGRSSTQVLETLRHQLQSLSPDLVIIYSGNNEFYSLLARKMLLTAYSPRLELLRHRLWGLRSYRLLSRFRGAMGRPTDDTVGIDERTFDIPVEPADHRLAAIIYRDNLENMVKAAAHYKAKILLTTVGTNQIYSPQINYEDRGSLDRAEPFKELVRKGGGRAALEKLAAKMTVDPSSHEGQFLFGLAHYAAGDTDKARPLLHRAEVLDPRPQRCTEPLRQTLLSLGKAGGTPTCDTARALDRLAKSGISGFDMFGDSCHPTRGGHRILARAMVQCILDQKLLPLKKTDPAAVKKAFTKAEAQATDVYRLDNDLLSDPHHEKQNDPPRPEDPKWLVSVGMELFRDYTVNTGGDDARIPTALKQMNRAQAAGAPEGAMTYNRALILLQLGKHQKALPLLRKAAALMPGDPDVRNQARVVGAL